MSGVVGRRWLAAVLVLAAAAPVLAAPPAVAAEPLVVVPEPRGLTVVAVEAEGSVSVEALGGGGLVFCVLHSDPLVLVFEAPETRGPVVVWRERWGDEASCDRFFRHRSAYLYYDESYSILLPLRDGARLSIGSITVSYGDGVLVLWRGGEQLERAEVGGGLLVVRREAYSSLYTISVWGFGGSLSYTTVVEGEAEALAEATVGFALAAEHSLWYDAGSVAVEPLAPGEAAVCTETVTVTETATMPVTRTVRETVTETVWATVTERATETVVHTTTVLEETMAVITRTVTVTSTLVSPATVTITWTRTVTRAETRTVTATETETVTVMASAAGAPPQPAGVSPEALGIAAGVLVAAATVYAWSAMRRGRSWERVWYGGGR